LDAGRDDKDGPRRPPRSDRDPVRRSEEEIVDPGDYYGGGYGPDSYYARSTNKNDRLPCPAGQGNGDRQRWIGGHGTRSSDPCWHRNCRDHQRCRVRTAPTSSPTCDAAPKRLTKFSP
jgi:hypothetical protein